MVTNVSTLNILLNEREVRIWEILGRVLFFGNFMDHAVGEVHKLSILTKQKQAIVLETY